VLSLTQVNDAVNDKIGLPQLESISIVEASYEITIYQGALKACYKVKEKSNLVAY